MRTTFAAAMGVSSHELPSRGLLGSRAVALASPSTPGAASWLCTWCAGRISHIPSTGRLHRHPRLFRQALTTHVAATHTRVAAQTAPVKTWDK